VIAVQLTRVFFVIGLAFIISSCNPKEDKILIAVASNFEPTLSKILKDYKDSQNRIIHVTSASSGVLANQILNGAPIDLFLSADIEKTKIIYEKLKLSYKPKVYATGKLALWIPSIDDSGDCLFVLNNINSLAIANPETAPYGQFAQTILTENKIQPQKTVITSNAAQAYLYTHQNLANAGFVPYSMITKNDKGCIQTFSDDSLQQAMIMLTPKGKEIFDFLLSHSVQRLIQEDGYEITKQH
jgi:molybdate transport system substrate-binding protein